ncbi:MAG: DUF1003 domain-containing protein [Deltaproteobacteria bacterium]|nr:DUF1003 domain-containing protein [Deltaproteobacteria bacterium]MCB9787942.1 DUF1003 domain-containing protein [Deltaproteobacteria bacterium]
MSRTSHAAISARCMVCGQDFRRDQCQPVALIRPSMALYLRERHPDSFSPEASICRPCLGAARQSHLLAQLARERGDLSALEAEASRTAAAHTAIAAHLDETFQSSQTPAQRLADAVATVGGSWPFVIGFGAVLFGWILLNSALLGRDAFDPYPYILLNLVLSCLAAIQAPIIMMSQNRRSVRDRMEADEDFKVNLKAELEVAALHEKIDHLLYVQWERMVEIQQTQLDLLDELSQRRR